MAPGKEKKMRRPTTTAVTRLLASGLLLLITASSHAATAPVGATPGSFAVSPSGAATYSIPLAVPPGTNGMAPQLSLHYNSQGGNGLVGMGWSIGGLSVIHRCGSTIAIDGVKGGVNHDAHDKFCLDGERLISIGGNEYRTQHESWQKVVAVGGTASDPSYFTVTAKEGTIQYYGATADSRVEAQGKTVARLWALNKVEDRNSNYLAVIYQEDNANGDYRPARIDYTGNAGTGTPIYNSVYFDYIPFGVLRPDVTPLYEGGSVIKVMQRLHKIRTSVGASREYRLNYDNNGAAGRSRLTSIQECGGGVCLPATNLLNQTGGTGFDASLPQTGHGISAAPQFHDMNGNERQRRRESSQFRLGSRRCSDAERQAELDHEQ